VDTGSREENTSNKKLGRLPAAPADYPEKSCGVKLRSSHFPFAVRSRRQHRIGLTGFQRSDRALHQRRPFSDARGFDQNRLRREFASSVIAARNVIRSLSEARSMAATSSMS